MIGPRPGDIVCVCVCVCVCMDELLVSRAHNRNVVSSNLSPDMEKKIFLPSSRCPPTHTSLPSCDGYPALLGCKFTGHTSRISYGFRWDFGCPHPQAVRCGQYSCEFLARLQEFPCTGLQSLLSAQASWLCQVCVTA